MRPLVRTIAELGVRIDYRPGGVSMTSENFAKLEVDRRRNAERLQFLLAAMKAPGTLDEQIAALDKQIDDLLAAHMRISSAPGKRVTVNVLDSDEWSFTAAMKRVGAPQRFIDDAIQDMRNAR